MSKLYRAYLSEDSGTESDSDGYTTEESLLNVPGKRAPVETGNQETYPVVDSKPPNTGTAFESTESVNTNIVQIQSRDRDYTSYPQPTSFSIRLPRVFKSVKSVNISQINLLNSFFSFSKDLGNTNMYVYEYGRTKLDSNGVLTSNVIDVTIRDGNYTAQDLADELSNSMNNTPLFSDLSLGDFISKFQSTGDYSLPFNTPNSNAFNNLTNQFDSNQTIDTIVGRYFQTVQTFGQTSYSYNESLVVYYYPVVKELIIKTITPTFSVVGQSIPQGFTSWYDYIVFAFQGVDDPYITKIVTDSNNQVLFDAYRNSNTFNNSLVNGYTVTYNGLIGRYNFAASGLCYSISNDLSNFYNSNLANIASGTTDPTGNFNGNLSDFLGNVQSNTNSNIALTNFYNFIHSQFTNHFGVDFGQYSAEFFGDPRNQLTIYNTLNKYGWNTSLTPQVSSEQLSSTKTATQCPNLWPNIHISTSQSTFISTLGVPDFPGINNRLEFPNAGENTFGYVDVYFRQQPTTYNRIKFTTRCRQNISLMALPRRIDNRGPGTEEVYNFGPNVGQTPLLFDSNSSPPDVYILCDVSGNPYFNLYTLNQPIIDQAQPSKQDPSYLRSSNNWLLYIYPQILAGILLQSGNSNLNANPPVGAMVLTSYRPYIHFELDVGTYNAPPWNEPNAHFLVDIYVETQDGANFPVPLKVSFYKDRAAFMADVPYDLTGDNSYDTDRHSFQVQTVPTTTNSFKMTVDGNNNQRTYLRVRTSDINNLPSSIPIRIFCVLTNSFGEYDIATQNDRLDMPFSTMSTLLDQFTPASDTLKNPLKSIYDSTITHLGYDMSGVSNNLLDYIIQSGNNNFYDPNNITDYQSVSTTGLRYMFDYYTGGAGSPLPTISSPQTWSLYFGSNTSNVLRDTYNTSNNIYLSSLQVPKPLESNNKSLLVNWFNANSIVLGNIEPVERFLQPDISADTSNVFTISSSSVFLPCINNPTIRTDTKVTPSFYDSTGFSGMSFFLPPSKIVSLDTCVIKFTHTQPSSDMDGNAIGRQTPPFPSLSKIGTASTFNFALYRNQTTHIQTSNSPPDEWDDWLLYNRRNLKMGVFPTDQISGASVNSLQLSSALCTLTLQKVTQVNNYQDQLGTLRTREPGWGTWYTYKADTSSTEVWDVDDVNWSGSSGTYWKRTTIDPDFAPIYTDGDTSYPNYFRTPNTIHNYTYLPRSFGVAPAVGNALFDPSLLSTFVSDIPNSYTLVPFFKDPITGVWKVGTMYGISYTRQPCVPDPAVLGASPYYGPPGGYGWTNTGGTFQLYNGDSTNSMYYWNAKIAFNELEEEYNPATDLSTFGGYTGISEEYQDTVLFMYDNKIIFSTISTIASTVSTILKFSTITDYDLGDVSTTQASQTVWKWGQENVQNYQAYDDQNGYNFLSYIYDQPIRHGTIYATHIRAYAPTPAFTTGIRFIGKNVSDFGTLTLAEIAGEISTLQGYVPITDVSGFSFIQNLYSSPPNYGIYASTISTNNSYLSSPASNIYFSHEYADALIRFNSSFVSTFIFGQTNVYPGITYTFSSFANALSSYIVLYSTIQSNLNFYSGILSTATVNLDNYLVEKYGSVLPANIVERNNITDPLAFQFLFQSQLQPPYTTRLDYWGLGYNLGFNKADTSPPKTSITSDNFIRVVQDYIYMRLNPELNMNPIAISGKENLSETHDSMGEDTKYFAKILLNSFGNFCSTAIINPKTFNPVLGKLDTIRCQLVDKHGNVIDNMDCEYDFVLAVSEVENGPPGEASLIRPQKVDKK